MYSCPYIDISGLLAPEGDPSCDPQPCGSSRATLAESARRTRPVAPCAQAGHMAGTSSAPLCACDCGDPDAGRHQLLSGAGELLLGGPWPLCVCPHCGPEPVHEGGRRQCTTSVHPIVAAFTPGGLLLCEECRESCRCRMREAERMKRGRHGVKRASNTEDAESNTTDAKCKKS